VVLGLLALHARWGVADILSAVADRFALEIVSFRQLCKTRGRR